MNPSNLLHDIPQYTSWSQIRQITKGWSGDKKYFIKNERGEHILLRLSDISQYQTKQQDFAWLKKIATLGINMSQPLDFGICADGKYVYTLFTWVNGVDADSILTNLSKNQQYEHGVNAGCLLRQIHSLAAPLPHENWAIRYGHKIQQKLTNYANCVLKLENGNEFIRFIQKNTSYLANRPQVFHHGDFHTGNLIISPENTVGVIDFNRMDYGDPWEEFNRIIFSWRVSVPFTVGQIHGYFNNDVPDLFFRLMALYIATNMISSLAWAIPFGDAEIEYMRGNAAAIFKFYNGFTTYVPMWYENPQNSH